LSQPLSEHTRRTFQAHLGAHFFEGIFTGVWLLNDIVARKHFDASPILVTLLVMSASASLILSLPLGSMMAYRPKRIFFLMAGVPRLAFLLCLFCGSATGFVILASIASISYPLFFTAQNAILKSNYGEGNRGKLFGLVYSFSGLMAIFSSLTVGRIYDLFPDSPSVIYPLAALAGFASCVLMSGIREEGINKKEPTTLVKPLDILKKRPDFRKFEISYFFYGTGFMMMLPLLPLYLVDHLKVTYSQASFLNGLFYQGMIVIFSWFMGRLTDRVHPLYLNKAGFAALVFYPLSLSLAAGVLFAYPAYAWYGISMAVVNVSWYLAPLTFCHAREEASSFGALHVALAGVRAFIAFPLGTFLYSVSGTFWVPFLTSSSLFLVSSMIIPSPDKIISSKK
jgi:MFS family permease